MKKETPLLMTIALLLLIAAFEPMASTIGPPQPPIDTRTLYVGRDGWGPKYADPVAAHDEYSQELIFNAYDRLLTFGTPVTNQYKTNWDVQEQYWEFSPSLATNVPTRQEVTGEFINTSMHYEIVIRNEDPIDWPFPIPIFGAYNTFWEDSFLETPPNYAYKLTNIIDFNHDGILDPGDIVETNIYLWAPVTQDKIYLVQDLWWRVIQCDQLMPSPPPLPPLSVLLHLSLISNPNEPYPFWFTGPSQGVMYQCVGYVDNNPDGTVGYCDVLYLKEYNVVPVEWFKIGPGFELQPVTCRTWHVLGVSMPPLTLQLHRYYYDFQIRTTDGQGNPIYFVDETGAIVDVFDIYDAEYSFKRGLVQDPLGGPMYKFYEPLFDQMNSDYWRTNDTEDGIELAYLIDDAIEIVNLNPPVLRINLGIPFPSGTLNNAFLQIMCGTWASIVSREFSIGISCWDGDLFRDVDQNCVPDWFQFGTALSPYDSPAKRYVGTGPYRVVLFDPMNQLVIMDRNVLYWRGWPAPDRVNYLDRIDIEYIADFVTRANAFQACQLDICDVPRSRMSYLMDPYGNPSNPHVKTIKKIGPVYDLYSVLFKFIVDPISPYVPLVGGIPRPDLFNNTHVRKAFAYSFDHAAYLSGPFNSEAICRETPDVYCLVPDYYIYGPDPPWTYDENYAAAQAELQAAGIWNNGFIVTMFYPNGDDDAFVACTWISTFFATLGPQFVVNIVPLPRPTFQNEFEDCWLPVCVMKWHANYADADDWKRAYMHSQGCLAYFQGYTSANGWNTTGPRTGWTKDQLIDLAVKTPDGPTRTTYYADLDDIYIMDCPSFPIAQPLERKWMKCWVKGWYYNALYPSNYYYYKLYKADTCIGDVTGRYVGVPDGVCDMRDIGYIAGHFGVGAPDPHRTPPYNPRWAPGTYGYGGCDIYGDRVIDMRDIGLVASHFGHTHHP